MKRLVSCFYNALKDLIRHDGMEFAGYLSFLTILSLFPALILSVMLLGFIFKLSDGSNVVQQLAQLLFDDTGISEIVVTLRPRIEEIVHSPPQNVLEVAVIGMLWTASSTIQGWHVILNRAYRIKSAHSYITRRLTSIAQFLFMVFLIAFAALIISMLNIFAYKSSSIAMQEAIQDNLSIQYILITFIILTSILWVHLVIPDKKQTIKEVLPGAILTVFLLLFLAKGFKIYTKRFSQLGAIYGSLEGTVITLLFFYAVNLCIIYGAEANYNLHCRHKDRGQI